MKKRYYLSMLSLFPLIVAFDSIYFVLHQSLELFLLAALAHFVLFGLLNYLGTYFLYRPIDQVFIQSKDTKQAKKRIHHLTWYSTGWIFFLGILSICYQIIQEHHGKIDVESQPGKGSVFTVILPTEF